jgi:predicted RNA-binding Zn-ribbon protein involved in translation (DUF1610 family)
VTPGSLTFRRVGVFEGMETCSECYAEIARWSNERGTRCPECGEVNMWDPPCANCAGHGYEIEGWQCPVCGGQGRLEA